VNQLADLVEREPGALGDVENAKRRRTEAS
jgi:hypothetical protein